MTLKNFVVILIILSARSCEGSERDCRFFYDKSVITFDENTNNFEFHCDTSEDVTEVWLEDFSGNRFPNEAFTKFPQLNKIVIILKNNLNVLNENFFAGEIQNKIKTLVIDAEEFKPSNQEKVIFDYLLKFPELEILEIHRFNFDTIENFKFNEKLTGLELIGNKIKKLEKNSISNLKNLERLQLLGNEIQVLPENLLKNNLKLKQILFGANQIKEIPRKFFWGLIELESINFAGNLIQFLYADLLKDNHKLTHVNFGANKIRKISPHIFENLNNLRDKYFSNNPCTEKTPDDLTNCFTQWNSTVNSIENDNRVCGKSLLLLPRVFGGSPIVRGQYPWIAAFYYHNKFHCGSSLISGKHILLAAHFIHDKRSTPKDPKDCKFALGKFNLTADEDGSLDVEVSEFILHPNWDSNSVDYHGDVAVAVLKTIVEFTQFIRPICLNEQKLSNFYNKTGTVIGWGATELNPREGSDVALEVELKIHKTSECLYLDKDLVHIFSPQSFCAGNRNGTGSCVGDSGGAIIVTNVNRFKALGVVSASLRTNDGFCDTSKNQIYTEVAAYYNWIMDHVIATY